MGKTDLKVNFDVIGNISSTLSEYKKALDDIKLSMTELEKAIKTGKGEAMQSLSNTSLDITKKMEEVREEVEDLFNLFNGYKEDMCGIISPINLKK